MAPTTKRKSNTLDDPRLAKQRRMLDSYFNPQVLPPASSVNDNDRRMVTLNSEQTAILKEVVNEGKNLFFTGSAGTGKSLLLRAIITALHKKHGKTDNAVSVTASTGMAASNIGGMTLHSWGGVSPTTTDVDQQVKRIGKIRPALQRWQKTKVLVIDEVSMLDGPLFSLMFKVAQKIRKTDTPFGGIQLVVTGDFFQLPPVSKNGAPIFAFESEEWKSSIQRTLTLSQVFRQKDDDFVHVLNQLRLGTVSSHATNIFKSLSRALPPDPAGILPTELFPLRNEVDAANSTRLNNLTTPSYTFDSLDSGTALDEQRQKLLDNMMAPKTLVLKTGAQVMLIKNMDERLVNGSVGKVIGFYRIADVQAKSNDSKNGNAPVRNVIVSDGKPARKEHRNKENAAPSTKGVEPKAKNKAKARDDTESYPLVQFSALDGSYTEAVLLVREEFRVEDAQGSVLARRKQVPLILAWAMSIHKSQGQTIHRVKIDLGRVFEKGQAYVALSRAASLSGLQVLGFDPHKAKAHPKVVAWSKALQSA